MVSCKVVPVSKAVKRCNTPDPPPSKCYSAAYILVVLFMLFLAGLAVACVAVGGVPLYRCMNIMLLDVWLIAHGVSALGAFVGLCVWSNKMATGKFVNGPKIFALLLITLNFIWLVLGNIHVIAAYVTCGTTTFLGTVACNSGFLHFALVVIIIFDIAYIAFFVLLCIAYTSNGGVKGWTHPALGETGCCARPTCFSTFYGMSKRPSWQEWVIIIALICYTLLAITGIALGAVYLNICPFGLWVPYWLIVHGVVTLVTFITMLCCLGFPGWVDISWSRTSYVAFMPVLVLLLFLLFWLTIGNVRAAEFRISNCPAADNCNNGLQIFTLVWIFLLDLPFLVIVYIGTILFILLTIMLIFMSCYKCCRKVDRDTAPVEETPERCNPCTPRCVGDCNPCVTSDPVHSDICNTCGTENCGSCVTCDPVHRNICNTCGTENCGSCVTCDPVHRDICNTCGAENCGSCVTCDPVPLNTCNTCDTQSCDSCVTCD